MGHHPRYLPGSVHSGRRHSTTNQSGSLNGGNNEQERSPREAVEAVRERIKGEALVSTYGTADTKTGVLTIHLTGRSIDAEIYADEVTSSPSNSAEGPMGSTSIVVCSPKMIPAIITTMSTTVRS